MKYYKVGALPEKGEIFVFGGNQDGSHGEGEALKAKLDFGARPGKYLGLAGQSYAIPTQDRQRKTLEFCAISRYVKIFLNDAIHHHHLTFFVTRIGCGIDGYADKQIAQLFEHAPGNCILPETWGEFLEPAELAEIFKPPLRVSQFTVLCLGETGRVRRISTWPTRAQAYAHIAESYTTSGGTYSILESFPE